MKKLYVYTLYPEQVQKIVKTRLCAEEKGDAYEVKSGSVYNRIPKNAIGVVTSGINSYAVILTEDDQAKAMMAFIRFWEMRITAAA